MIAGEPRKRRIWPSEGMTNRSQWQALRSPIFWLALLVLAANDHFLKGSGLLPGWLTGKLSDFAGLVVAPVLLVALLRARHLAARATCFVAVAGVFVAIKLAPGAARVVEQLMGSVGLRGRIWSDPTDLIALGVLPLAWWVLDRTASPAPRRSTPLSLLERLGAIAATLACLATTQYVPGADPGPCVPVTDRSVDPSASRNSLIAMSRARGAVPLQVFRPPTPLDCKLVRDDPQGTIKAEDFASEFCQKVDSQEAFSLSSLGSCGSDPDSGVKPPAPRRCEAVLVRGPGLEDTILAWNDVTIRSSSPESTLELDEGHVVYVEQVGERLFLAPPDAVLAWQPSFTLPPASCEAPSP